MVIALTLSLSVTSTLSIASANTASELETDIKIGYTGSQVKHGIDCRYQYIDKYNYVMSSGGDLPTKYDQQDFVWEHHSGSSAILKGTISYNNAIADIQVNVPWIGLNTSTATVGGVTFSFRTGPNKCSIKVSQSGITSASFRFAFARAYN